MFVTFYFLLCWMPLCWMPLCWMPLCWIPLCWMPLCWMPLCWMSLCCMSWRRFDKNSQGILKGEVSLYCIPPVWLVWNQLNDNWQFLFLLAKQANPKPSNRRSTVQWYFPFSIPWIRKHMTSLYVLFQSPIKNCIFIWIWDWEMEQLIFSSSLIIEGATEKLSHFLMPLKSIYLKNNCFKCQNAFLNSEGQLKHYTISKITSFFCSVYLFRAAIYELVVLLHKDTVFRWLYNIKMYCFVWSMIH